MGFVLMLHPCGAQNVSGQDALFRGKMSDRYSSNFNGTPYWDAEGFMPGSILYNGKRYDGVYINVDAALCEVNVKPSPEIAATSPDRNQVSWFTRGGKRFVNLQYLGVEGAREGFYEVLFDGNVSLLKRVDKFLHKDTGNHNTEGMIGYILEIYDERSCEVEFSDADSGATVACQAIDKACFEVIDD